MASSAPAKKRAPRRRRRAPTPAALKAGPRPARKGRLRRSDCGSPGLRRIKRGRGFSYVDDDGRPIKDREVVERIAELAIPPAWQDVWICPDPLGHLQATGVDAAGRKQYLYHTRWREHRDRQKFDKMLRFAGQLPKLRRELGRDLKGKELTRERVLACAVRLLDLGMFRIGSEAYADDDGGLGLATVRKEHVSVQDETIIFDYLGKAGPRRVQAISDPVSHDIVCSLKRRRGGGDELLAYRRERAWCGVRSADINDYIKERVGEDFSAKDFRTWNATVLAAVSLATDGRDATTKSARKRAVDRSVRAVAELLGNTPAVARRAYIDPRVTDRYLSGWTIAAALERIPDLDPADDRVRARVEQAVLDLLTDKQNSSALEHAESDGD